MQQDLQQWSGQPLNFAPPPILVGSCAYILFILQITILLQLTIQKLHFPILFLYRVDHFRNILPVNTEILLHLCEL